MQIPVDWREVIFAVFSLAALIQLCYYLFFFRRVAFFKPVEKQQSQTHPISVVVCARDEAGSLAKNLPGVLVQSYPTTHEVIVVNDNSQDETRFLLEELKKTFKSLQVVNLSHEAKGIPGKKYPLSIGIKEARHEVVLLTDADCVPASEYWMHRMQDGYQDGKEIVLGYGGYFKRPGFLNKLIRFDCFHGALQYLSYALAGTPYMGVGRNLSYKRSVFLRHKGFSSINHVPSGDDDLFISMAATKKNTGVMMNPESFTLSEPHKRFRDWMRQKTRHYTTAKFYKAKHKFLLGLYSFSHFMFYPLFIASLLFFDWRYALAVFAVRMFVQGLIYQKAMKKLDEGDLFSLWWLFDLLMFFYYVIFSSALWKKPQKTWR